MDNSLFGGLWPDLEVPTSPHLFSSPSLFSSPLSSSSSLTPSAFLPSSFLSSSSSSLPPPPPILHPADQPSSSNNVDLSPSSSSSFSPPSASHSPPSSSSSPPANVVPPSPSPSPSPSPANPSSSNQYTFVPVTGAPTKKRKSAEPLTKGTATQAGAGWQEYMHAPKVSPVHDALSFLPLNEQLGIVVQIVNANSSYSPQDQAWICYRQNQFKVICLFRGPDPETMCINDMGVPRHVAEVMGKLYVVKEVAGVMGDEMRVGLHHVGKKRLKSAKVEVDFAPFAKGKIEFANLQFDNSNAVKRPQQQSEFFHIVAAVYAKTQDGAMFHVLSKISPKIIVRGQNPGFYGDTTATLAPNSNSAGTDNNDSPLSPSPFADPSSSTSTPSPPSASGSPHPASLSPSTVVGMLASPSPSAMIPSIPPSLPPPAIVSSTSTTTHTSVVHALPPSHPHTIAPSHLSNLPPSHLSLPPSHHSPLPPHPLPPSLPPHAMVTEEVEDAMTDLDMAINRVSGGSNWAMGGVGMGGSGNGIGVSANGMGGDGMVAIKKDDGWTKMGDNIYHHGRVGINTAIPMEALTVNGNMLVTGEIYKPSDRRIKSNFEAVEGQSQLRNIRQLKLYDYSVQGRRERGVLAQELAETMPTAVHPVGDVVIEVNGEQVIVPNLLVVNERSLLYENIGATKQLDSNLECEKENIVHITSEVDHLKKTTFHSQTEMKRYMQFMVDALFKEEHKRKVTYAGMEEEYVNFQFSVFRMGPARSLFLLGHFSPWLWVLGALYIFSNVRTRKFLGFMSLCRIALYCVLSLLYVDDVVYNFNIAAAMVFAAIILFINYQRVKRRLHPPEKKDKGESKKPAQKPGRFSSFYRYCLGK